MSGRVIVVGSVNVDLVITVDRMPGPARPSPAAATSGITAARAATRPWRQPASGPRRLRRGGRDDASAGARGRRWRPKGSTVAAGRARRRTDRRRAHPGRPRRREQHRGRRRREHGARLRAGPRRAQAAGPDPGTSSWSATRSGPARRTRPCASAGSPGATTILNPAPAGGLDRDRPSTWRTSSRRTGVSSGVPAGGRRAGCRPVGDRAVMVSLGDAPVALLGGGAGTTAGHRGGRPSRRCGRHRSAPATR